MLAESFLRQLMESAVQRCWRHNILLYRNVRLRMPDRRKRNNDIVTNNAKEYLTSALWRFFYLLALEETNRYNESDEFCKLVRAEMSHSRPTVAYL